MAAEELIAFRLVGCTALSLQLGHRTSVDIDLFSDAAYGSIDFIQIENYLQNTFKYIDFSEIKEVGMGKSYFIGNSANDCVKLDLFYTDAFIRAVQLIDSIRLASLEEIAAIKIDILHETDEKKILGTSISYLNSFQLIKCYICTMNVTHTRTIKQK